MQAARIVALAGGVLILVIGLGFCFQLPFATAIWPWPDGRLSYLFIGSILASVSADALWVGWKGEWGALPAGSLNILVIALGTAVYFFSLSANGRPQLLPFALFSSLAVIASAAAFLWSSRIPLSAEGPTPLLVRISFGVFILALLLASLGLILRLRVFPWSLNPDSSVIFGCIFLGDAFYFLHALLKPGLNNARGQLLSFLAYDLVLIVPFLLLFKTVKPESLLSLTVYVAVLVYSGALAVYILFIDRRTRLFQ